LQWQNGGFAYAPDSIIAQISAFLSSGNSDNAYKWQDAYNQELDWENWNRLSIPVSWCRVNSSAQQVTLVVEG
jgi:hypothetical protein